MESGPERETSGDAAVVESLADGAVTRPDPPLWARLLADRYLVARIAVAILVVAPGWATYAKLHAGLPVPSLLLLYLSVGLAGSLALGWAHLASAQVRRSTRIADARRETPHLLREARDGLRDHRDQLSASQTEALGHAADELEQAQQRRDWDRASTAAGALDRFLDEHLGNFRRGALRDYLESILIAVCIALFLRAFVFEAFKIPTGSMIPTMQVGDYIFVNKFIYGVRVPWTDIKIGQGLRAPERGEVVVFKYPEDPDRDFIKRIVGVGGDTVEIRDDVPWVNGVAIPHEHVTDDPHCSYQDIEERTQRWTHRRCDAWRETVGTHRYTTYYDRSSRPRSWPRVTVPSGMFFVMGDNRDNSLDSRYWGFVRRELLRGKAMLIWWSFGEPEGVRAGRIGRLIE